MSEVTEISGGNVAELVEYRESMRDDRNLADHNPILVAHWIGESRPQIEFKDATSHVGDEDMSNTLLLLLASLAACDVELVTMNASLLGLEIESLSVEAAGLFHVSSYLGLDDAPDPGYNGVKYTVHLHVPSATPAEIAHLREQCECCSPPWHTLHWSPPERWAA